jgi:hypothetical protein
MLAHASSDADDASRPKVQNARRIIVRVARSRSHGRQTEFVMRYPGVASP